MELIISVGILSIGIVVILQAFSFSARAAGRSCDIINALLLAEDKMQELEFMEKISAIPSEGKSGVNEKFSWRYDIALDPKLVLYKVNFNIFWDRPERKEEIKLSTYLRNEEK